MTDQVIKTGRLILRKFTKSDAPFIVELLNTPSFISFIGDRKVRSIKDAENYIENRINASFRINGFGMWLVMLKDGERAIGTCGLVNREDIEDVDIGFAFLPEFMGKGYGYESAKAVLEYSREELKLDRIAAIVNADNVVSKSLLKKLGFVFIEVITLNDGKEVEFMLPS